MTKGQKSIASFFGGGPAKKSTKKDESSDVEMDDEVEAATTTKPSAPESTELPPIHSIPAMFTDLVSRIPKIKDVADHVQGRKLRVATMCSGTESPLLALDLIRRSLRELHNTDLDVEHVFSCEIEPFKQAYIERNFHPPLLFRDVCELGQDQAHTAYGSLAPVPGDVDLLIAGTSCVDYSNLNNVKQDIDAQGESGRTFRGMMGWVTKHRPPIVILENVCSAPWDRVAEYFEKKGYSAAHTRVDTKHYYIPHTRTRVYLVAVDQKNSSLPAQWKEYITSKLKRHASSSLDAFLLPTDDPRIHYAREKLVREGYNALDRRTGRTDWGRCESRHQRARLEEELGSKRPLTSWEEGGFCKLPDFAWGDWGVGQVERVWDLMDISLLRSAKKGVDPSYKTQVWNLSQNVDRTIGSNKVGICPCLTPSMIPYITNRGGPMVGLEALSMQGLPVDELLLTRETEDQLADLAGNAMSTTVVGACILAALVTGRKLLKAGDDTETYEFKRGDGMEEDNDHMKVDKLGEDELSAEDHISGEQQLQDKPLDLSATSEFPLSKLLEDALKSARLCECEGRKDITSRPLNRCLDCGTSSCVKCGGRPEHNNAAIDVIAEPRLSPSTFAKELKATLPMCISVSGITRDLLDKTKVSAGVSIPEKRWAKWCSAVVRASEQELRFVEPKRQEIWAITYQSTTSSLELLLHPQQPEWRLYAKPEDSEPANSEVRALLELPVGRFTCSGDLLSGKWQFALPFSTAVPITIEGTSELVPSWESRLGLLGDEFKNKMVFSQLSISVPEDKARKFDRDISGTYTLLEKCGTANGALHRKEQKANEADLPPLFMLFDPHRTNDAEDAFAFSTSKRRYDYGESRPVICKLDPKWRQTSDEGKQETTCYLPCVWETSESVSLVASHQRNARFLTPGDNLEIVAGNDACRSANAFLVCKVPLQSQASDEWPRGEWKEVDKVHERNTFKSIAWVLERVRRVDDRFSSWQNVPVAGDQSNCDRCAPGAPAVEWRKAKQKMVAVEDSAQAGEYERRLKRRPSPFVTQLKLGEDNIGTVRIGINIASLLHRAVSRLPSKGRMETPTVSWRLNTDFNPVAQLNLPKFEIMSNKLDKEHTQPPNFKLPLRKEQLRSLEWMLRQESPKAAPFTEEEISEAILEPLGWRAEGRAQRLVQIRGGVLADQVGYGKTAITLGVIDCAQKTTNKEFENLGRMEGKIRVKGTLVIVPPHLTRQWDSEVQKFAGKRFKTVVLSTAANLNAITIENIQEADIVIVASNLFQSSVYLENLETLAAAGPLPNQDGRHFNARLDLTLAGLRSQTDRLQDEGSKAVYVEVLDAQKRAEKEEAEAQLQLKRLKGKSYRDAAEAQERKKKEDLASGKTSSTARQPSGTKVEVVIQSKSSVGVKPKPRPKTETKDSESDSDVPKPKKRRASVKEPIVISEDDEKTGPVKKKNRTSSKKVPNKRKVKQTESSDYEGDSGQDSSSEDETEADVPPSSDDDQSEHTSGTTSRAPSKSKGKGKRSNPSSDDEGEDSKPDEPKKKSATTKRKAADDDKPPAKKQKRRGTADPWKLESSAVKKNWEEMKAPPLEMFHFARKVVDEYTYLEGKIHSMVTNLTADRHWVLSGTPPIHDFGALKTIAAFLNLHLGVDDDAEGQSAQVKKRRREQTAVEKFHSFREVHSLEWHAHRHELGQIFLDHFVRQNIAEIDEIPWTEKIEKITLPAAERAIYLELEHHLRALDMTIKRGRKTESDREKRLAKSLGESASAEEALLKRCSHFDLEMTHDNALKACDVIVKERQKQLDECEAELLKSIVAGVQREKKIGQPSHDSLFQEYIRVTRKEGVGDDKATKVVRDLLDKAGVTERAVPKNFDANKQKTKTKKEDDHLPAKVKEAVWEHREKTHEIRRLTKELVGRVRSLRYFSVVRDLQKNKDEQSTIPCPGCERDSVPLVDVAVLSSCGHMGCLSCVKEHAEKEECVYAASGGCKSAARVLNVVKADTLGVDEEREQKGKHFGMKLETVVTKIKKDLPKDDRVLIFVQFPDLMKKVAETLTYHKIKFLEIKGTAHQKSKNLEKFQNDGEERVLLLNVMDESASGANLTSANHAIFLSPLLAPTKEIYKACETQAVGRLVRYGQQKHVYVWRFLTANTIDEEIYDQRAHEDKSHS